MKKVLKIALLALLVSVSGCSDGCKDTPTENSTADPDPVVAEDDVQAKVIITIAKGTDFSFGATASSNLDNSLESGTWTVKDVTNLPVHSESGVQMSLTLDSHPNKCSLFWVHFVPVMKDGFTALEADRQRVEWPDEEDCRPQRLIADFSCRDTGSFVVNCLNNSTGEDPLSCRFSWGDQNGSTTAECGFNGVTFDYEEAGLFTVRLRMVDARGTVAEIDKLVRVE